MSSVGEIESLCRELYEGQNPDAQRRAQQQLLALGDLPDAIDRCRTILQESQVCMRSCTCVCVCVCDTERVSLYVSWIRLS
jgi:hypothetical protein